MAAILCQSIGSLCSGIGQIIALPCRLCGTACGSCCQATGQLLSSPFAPYLITTLVLNAPPVVWGLRSALQRSGGGNGPKSCSGDTWLWVNSFLCFVHMAAAFYIVHRLQEDAEAQAVPTEDPEDRPPPVAPHVTANKSNTKYQSMHDETRNSTSNSSEPPTTLLSSITSLFPSSGGNKREETTTTTNQETSTNQERSSSFRLFDSPNYDYGEAYSWQRLRQVLCYDVIVAMYILCALVWLVWQSMGISQAVEAQGAQNQNLDGGLCDQVLSWTVNSIVCGFLYASLVCIAFSCSVCCLRH